jgi:predicted nucleotidyltransferase
MTTFNQQLHGILANYPQIELAILFGSLAHGQATPQSDLDLAVQADKPLDVDLKMALIGDLAEAFGRPVDLVDLRTAGEPLMGQIFKGRRILGSTTAYGKLLAKHLRDVADFLPYRERILKQRRDAWINR